VNAAAVLQLAREHGSYPTYANRNRKWSKTGSLSLLRASSLTDDEGGVVGRVGVSSVVVGGFSGCGGGRGGSASSATVDEPPRAERQHRQPDPGPKRRAHRPSAHRPAAAPTHTVVLQPRTAHQTVNKVKFSHRPRYVNSPHLALLVMLSVQAKMCKHADNVVLQIKRQLSHTRYRALGPGLIQVYR